MKKLIATVLSGLAFIATHPVGAQDAYPSKPVRIVVPFAPGGVTDILARAVGERLGARLGQPVVVENRAGGGTVIASEYVAKLPADGYTIMLAASSLGTAPLLNPKVNYDPIKSFAPISQIVSVPHIVVVPSASPIHSIKDIIALAKKQPGKLSYASVGPGTSNHLEGELFKSMAKVFMVHIPYRGSSPALTDVVSGQVDLMFDAIGSAGPFVKSGRLRAIAVSTSRRSVALPDVPTVAESGLPGFDAMPWLGFVAPNGTPAPIVARLHQELVSILGEPDMKDRLKNWGLDPVASSPAEFSAFIAAEVKKWDSVIKTANIKAD